MTNGWVSDVHRVDTPNKGMSHILDDMRFYHTTQNGLKFKAYELFMEFFI